MKVLLAIVALALAGCGSKNADCSLEAAAAVNVTLKDATTKQPICDAKVVITDGADFRDEPLPVGQPCIYPGAYERAGTFKVEVTHPSYAPATREGIVVGMDEAKCHVVPQKVEIELTKP